jgi:apolipoprotein N-acyltransferase
LRVFLSTLLCSARLWSVRTSCLVALLAGALNVLSFAPFHLWPLQPLSLALIFLLSVQRDHWSVRQLALLGASYGFATLFFGVSWLLVAMTRYGGLPVWLALVGLMLLAGYLASYVGAALAAAQYLRQRWKLPAQPMLLLLLPALWTLSEWLRGLLFTGFPWLVSGYAHSNSPLSGYAALLGVYGVGWLSAIIGAALALTMAQRAHRFKLLSLVVVLLLLGLALRQHVWTQDYGQPISVRLLQGNVDQAIKFDAEHISESLALYHDMIVAEPADLIAAPETALPLLSSQLPADYLPLLNSFAQASASRVIVGLGVHDGENRYSNSVLGFGSEYASQAYRYDKHHLVPFGEFVPVGFHWFIQMMRIPLGDFSSAGVLQAAMHVKDQLVLPNICYEDLFGEEIAHQLAQQDASKEGAATILLNVSNLAWYGDSIAIPQHLQISQMRVLETGRPMLRATNTGATAVINARGEIVAQLKPLTKGSLHANVQGQRGMTPYILLGNAGIIVLALLSLLIAYLQSNRRVA